MNRSQIPQPQKPRVFNFPAFKRFRLDNGLQVIFAGHRKLPLITVELLVHSGADCDLKNLQGLASFVSEILPEGTKKRTSFQISQAFEQIGTQFNAHADWNASYLEMISVKKYLNQSLELFCDVLFNPVFAEEEIKRVRKQLLLRRMRVADNAGSIAREKLNQILFSGTRYADPLIGRSPQLKKITGKYLTQFYNSFYQPQNCTLIIVGDMQLKEVEELAGDYFGNWQNKKIEKPTEQNHFPQQKQKIYLIHKPGARQAEIRAGHLGINRLNPDYYACSVLNQILGGYFLSRLNQNLREARGFTYGIHSRFVTRKVAGSFHISTAVDTQYALEAVQEILKEIQQIRAEKVSEQELEQAKGYMTGIFPVAFESCSQIAAGLSSIVEQGLEDDYFRTYKDKIISISSEQVYKAAIKYLLPDQLSIVVCADKTDIESKFLDAFETEVTNVVTD
jgi:zinc protease